MKQTSVDWLAEQLNIITSSKGISIEEFEVMIHVTLVTARKMHREEVEEAVDDWMVNGNRKGKDYYSQTFETP